MKAKAEEARASRAAAVTGGHLSSNLGKLRDCGWHLGCVLPEIPAMIVRTGRLAILTGLGSVPDYCKHTSPVEGSPLNGCLVRIAHPRDQAAELEKKGRARAVIVNSRGSPLAGFTSGKMPKNGRDQRLARRNEEALRKMVGKELAVKHSNLSLSYESGAAALSPDDTLHFQQRPVSPKRFGSS